MTLAFRFVLALAVLVPLPARADDWPMFGGHADRNVVSSETGLPSDWDAKAKKNIKWVVDLGKQTYSNPVISGGRVFIGTNNDLPRDPAISGDKGILMCFSAADGKFLWQAAHDKLPGGINVDAESIGICSTPAVSGSRVYYVSNRDELVCRSVVDGKQLWLLDMRKELGCLQNQAAASSPLVVGDRVFVNTGHSKDHKEGKVLNPKAPSFIAVTSATGKVVWQDSSPGEKIISSQWGSPAYGVVEGQPQVAFPGGDGWIYSFEPDTGKLIWKFNCKAHEKLSPEGEPETLNQLVSMPVFAGPRVLIATGIDTDTNGPGCLRAIDARQKGDVTKTAELWKFAGEDFGCSISTIAVQEGLVYATELSGYLNCIELESGKRVWRHDLLAGIWGSPLVADGRVFIRTGDGDVSIFQAGREKKLIAKNETIPGLSHGSVVASGGVLYIAGTTKLYAIAETK